MMVKVANSGHEPIGGFKEYPVEIIVSDANKPPTCTSASEVVISADSGPISIPNFLINGSVGSNEQWQNLIVRIVPALTDRAMFAGSDGPTVDSSGTLLLETKVGSYGTVILSAICLDDGGTQGGGSNTSEPMQMTLRVLPHPTVGCVSPAILPVTSHAGTVLTITGQHFGGQQSRGYFTDDASAYYKHVQVFLGGVPCLITKYVSDTELICTGVEDGHGANDVEVRVQDPFFVSKMATSKAVGTNGSKSHTTRSLYPLSTWAD